MSTHEMDDYRSSPSSSTAGAGPKKKTRISRACENCRARRIKCQPPYPCQACRDAGLQDCLVREKARPLRRRRSQQAASAAIDGSSYPQRTRFLRSLEEQLEDIYASRTGENISLALIESPSHPLCDPSAPLPPMPDPLPPSVAEAMGLFTEYMLPFCSHLTAPRVLSLFERYLAAPNSLTPDQQALVLMCIGLGYVRLQGFEQGPGPLGSMSPTRTGNSGTKLPPPGRAVFVDDADRLDVPFFRHSLHILEKWGGASFTSLHALCVLWYYSCLACSPDTSRMIVAWMISQSKELGIHQETTAMQHSYAPSDRADLMFLQVLYAHYWTTALSHHPPIIKPGEFETMAFRSRPVVAEDQVVALVVRRSLTELLVINTQNMINIHDSRNATLPLDWLLRVEEKWDRWCSTWVMEGRTTGNEFSDPFVSVLWCWGRIALRLGALDDRRVSMSSLSVLARSATQIIVRYNAIYRRLPYNLMWQHLRQVSTCAHIILLCYWRYEITKIEAEIQLSNAVWMLGLMEPRWREQAAEAKQKIHIVSAALGLDLNPENVDGLLAMQSCMGTLHGVPGQGENYLDAQGALGGLYETFQNFNQDPSTLPAWTIDPLFLATDFSSSMR